MTPTLLLTLILAAPPAAAPVEIAPGVFLFRGAFVPGAQPDGNSVVLQGQEGLVVVDTGRHPVHTRGVLDFAAVRRQPIRAVVNTHWHLDHTGGNVLIRREAPDVRVFATSAIDDALKGFLARYAGQLKDVMARAKEGTPERDGYAAELARIESGLLGPDEAVTESGARALAGRKLDLHVERNAVTAADLWILDVSTGTLLAGDLVTLPVPFLDTACPAGWRVALDRLASARWKRLVPGHGPVMTRRDFERYGTAFGNLLACGASARTNEECASAWLSEAAPFLAGDDPAFVRQMLDYYLDGFLRPGAKTACAQ